MASPVWLRQARTAEPSDPAAQRIDTYAAGRPSRRSGAATASTRKASACRSTAASAKIPSPVIIP